jgi:hypothetical protein
LIGSHLVLLLLVLGLVSGAAAKSAAVGRLETRAAALEAPAGSASGSSAAMGEPGMFTAPTASVSEASPGTLPAWLKAWRAAKRTGDEASAREIGRRLGWTGTWGRVRQPSTPVLRGGGRKDSPVAGWRWSDDIPIDSSAVDMFYPSLAVRSSGHLYAACSVSNPPNGVKFYESSDGGLTWSFFMSSGDENFLVGRPSLVFGEGNSDVLLAAYTVRDTFYHPAWIEIVRYEPDAGWYLIVMLDVSSWPDVSDPVLCVDAAEYDYWYPYLVFAVQDTAEGLSDWDILYTYSTDYGLSFLPPKVIAEPEGLYSSSKSLDIAFGDGWLYVPFVEDSTGSGYSDIYMARSQDFGTSWDIVPVITMDDHSEFAPVVGAIHGASALLVAFGREYSISNSDMEGMYSTNNGTNWTWLWFPYTDEREGAPDLAVSPYLGSFHLVYWRNDQLVYCTAAYDDVGNWTTTVPINEGASATYPCVVANPTLAGEACIAWEDSRNGGWDPYFDAAYRIPSDAGPGVDGNPAPLRLTVGPNPFTGATRMRLRLPQEGRASLTIVDVRGRLVRRLLGGRVPAGMREVVWDGTDAMGRRLPAGVYFGVLEAAGQRVERKVVVE